MIFTRHIQQPAKLALNMVKKDLEMEVFYKCRTCESRFRVINEFGYGNYLIECPECNQFTLDRSVLSLDETWENKLIALIRGYNKSSGKEFVYSEFVQWLLESEQELIKVMLVSYLMQLPLKIDNGKLFSYFT